MQRTACYVDSTPIPPTSPSRGRRKETSSNNSANELFCHEDQKHHWPRLQNFVTIAKFRKSRLQNFAADAVRKKSRFAQFLWRESRKKMMRTFNHFLPERCSRGGSASTQRCRCLPSQLGRQTEARSRLQSHKAPSPHQAPLQQMLSRPSGKRRAQIMVGDPGHTLLGSPANRQKLARNALQGNPRGSGHL